MGGAAYQNQTDTATRYALSFRPQTSYYNRGDLTKVVGLFHDLNKNGLRAYLGGSMSEANQALTNQATE